jgi:hypothetical protein
VHAIGIVLGVWRVWDLPDAIDGSNTGGEGVKLGEIRKLLEPDDDLVGDPVDLVDGTVAGSGRWRVQPH